MDFASIMIEYFMNLYFDPLWIFIHEYDDYEQKLNKFIYNIEPK